MFSKGTWKGGITSNPINGQTQFLLVKGEILTWKNLQNTLKKNHTSLNKNQISPHFNPLITKGVCCPWKALSRVMSRNHKKNSPRVKIKIKIVTIRENPNLNQNKTFVIIKNLANLILRGNHLLSTTWDSCHAFYFFFLEKEICLYTIKRSKIEIKIRSLKNSVTI